MLRIKCPKCQTMIPVEPAQAGSVVACSQCGAKLRLPAARAAMAEKSAPAAPRPSPEEGIKPAAPAPVRKAAPPPILDDLDVVEEDEEQEEAPVRRKKRRRAAPRGEFDPVPYVPDGGMPAYGIPVLLGCVVVGGLFFGILAAFIGQWFYPIVLMPIGIGCGVWGAGYLGVRFGKVRSRLVGGLAGLFGASLAMFALHYVAYLEALAAAPGLAPGQQAGLAFSPRGFLRFVDARANDGVRLIRQRGLPNNRESNLGYVGSYAYWFAEFLMVAGFGVVGTLFAAAQPFCRRCQSWKPKREFGSLLAPKQEVIEALKDGDLQRLEEFQPGPAGGALALTVAACPHCEKKGEIDVKLEQVGTNYQGHKKKTTLVHLTYPRRALAILEELFRHG